MHRSAELALVAVGGAIGTALRHSLNEWLGDPVAGTVTVNLLGSFLIGLVVGRGLSDRLRLLLGTGVLGGFTTYSAFALQVHDLGGSGSIVLATAYATVTVVAGSGLSILGLRWGRR